MCVGLAAISGCKPIAPRSEHAASLERLEGMVATRRHKTIIRPRSPRSQVRVKYLSVEEGRQLLDRDARRIFGISGEDFVRLYRSGALNEEHTNVMRLGMLASTLESHR